MGKIKKKGTAGQAKNFITRTQAVRKLQISLPDFRRLCIFKGIYPREPRNKKKAAKNSTPSTTFYYTRDIQYLLHEPLLAKFREQKALAKKIGRHLGRGEVSDAARLERTHTPRITLDHVVKERYPTFVDALRDLDDALCMLFLFANLPSTSTIPPKTIALCRRLCLEFEHYIITSHSLRKSFLSIKGIYYQATIQGQDILWLVPYKFVQRMTGDIDFRIMGTFIEFYTTLLGFVNFRLYTSIGLVYPPKFDAGRDERGAELSAFSLESRGVDGQTSQFQIADRTNGTTREVGDAAVNAKAQAAADTVAEVQDADEAPADNADENEATNGNEIDTFKAEGEGADVLAQPVASVNTAATLFSDFVVFLSRETPRAPLEFLLKSFGCKRVGWDSMLGEGSFTADASDPRITHQIVDRPALPVDAADNDDDDDDEETREARRRARLANARVPNRTYVQPQWIWDCANSGKLLRPDLYAPGATLPPHLSPWVKSKRGAYDPTKPLGDDEGVDEDEAEGLIEAEEEAAEEDDDDDDEDAEDDEEQDFDVDGLDDELESEDEAAITSSKLSSSKKPKSDDFAGFSSNEEADDDAADAKADNRAARRAQSELLAEAQGRAPAAGLAAAGNKKKSSATTSQQQQQQQRRRRAEQEELDRQRMMLPRRKRKLLDKMLHSRGQTDEAAERLRRKRRRLEREAAATAL